MKKEKDLLLNIFESNEIEKVKLNTISGGDMEITQRTEGTVLPSGTVQDTVPDQWDATE